MTSRSPTVLFVESNRTGSGRDMAIACKRLAARPVILTRTPESYPDGYLAGFDQVIEADAADFASVMGAAEAIKPVAVSSSSDLAIEMAARVADARGLVGPDPDAVAVCRDKKRQIDRLKVREVAIPETVALGAGENDRERLVSELTPPLVVKPSRGTGSIDVRTFLDADTAWVYAQRLLRSCGGTEHVLAQELLDGPEFSVEMFNSHAVAVMRKHVGGGDTFVEVGHDLCGPADTTWHQGLVDQAATAVGALGLAAGPAHVEIRVGPAGPTVIEVNPRLAGGQIPAVVKLGLGVDLVTETLRWLLGRSPRLHPIRRLGAAIGFIVGDREGTLVGVTGVDSARQLPGVADVQVSPSGVRVSVGDFRQRVGYAIGVGNDCSSARRIVDAATALVKPEIAPV